MDFRGYNADPEERNRLFNLFQSAPDEETLGPAPEGSVREAFQASRAYSLDHAVGARFRAIEKQYQSLIVENLDQIQEAARLYPEGLSNRSLRWIQRGAVIEETYDTGAFGDARILGGEAKNESTPLREVADWIRNFRGNRNPEISRFGESLPVPADAEKIVGERRLALQAAKDEAVENMSDNRVSQIGVQIAAEFSTIHHDPTFWLTLPVAGLVAAKVGSRVILQPFLRRFAAQSLTAAAVESPSIAANINSVIQADEGAGIETTAKDVLVQAGAGVAFVMLFGGLTGAVGGSKVRKTRDTLVKRLDESNAQRAREAEVKSDVEASKVDTPQDEVKYVPDETGPDSYSGQVARSLGVPEDLELGKHILLLLPGRNEKEQYSNFQKVIGLGESSGPAFDKIPDATFDERISAVLDSIGDFKLGERITRTLDDAKSVMQKDGDTPKVSQAFMQRLASGVASIVRSGVPFADEISAEGAAAGVQTADSVLVKKLLDMSEFSTKRALQRRFARARSRAGGNQPDTPAGRRNDAIIREANDNDLGVLIGMTAADPKFADTLSGYGFSRKEIGDIKTIAREWNDWVKFNSKRWGVKSILDYAPQEHNIPKIISDKQAWIDFVMNTGKGNPLNRPLLKSIKANNGEDITDPKKIIEYLNRFSDSMLDRYSPNFQHIAPQNIRNLFFEDMHSQMLYHSHYGKTPFLELIASKILTEARNFGVRRVMGVRPLATMDMVFRRIRTNLDELGFAPDDVNRVMEFVERERWYAETLMGVNASVASEGLAKTHEYLASVLTAAHLGSASFAAVIGDPITSTIALRGLQDGTAGYARGFKQILLYWRDLWGEGERRRFVQNTGVLGHLTARNTFRMLDSDSDLASGAQGLTSVFLELTGLLPLTERARQAVAYSVLEILYEPQYGKALTSALREFGISADDIKVIQRMVGEQGELAGMPRALDLMAFDNSKDKAVRDIGLKLRAFLALQIELGVPTGSITTQAYQRLNTQPGTIKGVLTRQALLWTSYPLSLGLGTYRRLVRAEGLTGKAGVVAAGATLLAFSGFVQNFGIDIMRGNLERYKKIFDGENTLQDMADLYIRSFLRGSLLGYMGDVIQKSYYVDRFWTGESMDDILSVGEAIFPAANWSAPFFQSVVEWLDANGLDSTPYRQYTQGAPTGDGADEGAGEFAEFVRRTIPFNNFLPFHQGFDIFQEMIEDVLNPRD